MASSSLLLHTAVVFMCMMVVLTVGAKMDKKRSDVTKCERLQTRYRRRCGGEDEITKNLTALWNKVNDMAKPVQIYVNGKEFEVYSESSKHESKGSHSHHDHSHKSGAGASNDCEGYRFARCDVQPQPGSPHPHDVNGSVYFRQKLPGELEVKVQLQGFDVQGEKSLHGFHLHQYGDFSRGCKSFGGHYNPLGVSSHGGPGTQHSHLGDWGNLSANGTGHVDMRFTVQQCSLSGESSITGRGLVIHAGADDMGSGHSHSSKTSGNAGDRVACCAIYFHQGDCHVWGHHMH